MSASAPKHSAPIASATDVAMKKLREEGLKSASNAATALRSLVPKNWTEEKKTTFLALTDYLEKSCTFRNETPQDRQTPLDLGNLVNKLEPMLTARIEEALEKAMARTPPKTYASVVKATPRPRPDNSAFEVVINTANVAEDHFLQTGFPQEI